MPEFKDFFAVINRRIYDLEEPFKQGTFLDYQFKGRTSIKAILPVLCPRFSFADVNVQNGSQAMDVWYETFIKELDPSVVSDRRKDLLEYCRLDPSLWSKY